MATDKCVLCGEDVPWDTAGMGQTIKVVHGNKHTREMRKLGMSPQQYFRYCKDNYPRKMPDDDASDAPRAEAEPSVGGASD